MELWMGAVLLGLVFAGVFTLCEILVGTVLLAQRTGGMVLLVPLRPGLAEANLRRAVAWLEWQRGVFPGRVAAVERGLGPEERAACRLYCRGSGILWLEGEEAETAESFVAKMEEMDYT